MQAATHRAWQARLALMLILGVATAAACVVTLMLWKAPAASGQEETSPTGANFVVRCGWSHQKQVDPIVTPGPPPDKSSFHMHDFYGNKTTDANSTLKSLRAAASRRDHGTTCEPRPGKTFGDTAAYWIPTVSWTDSGGTTALKASQTFFYYRAGLKNPAEVRPHPAGLKTVTVQGKNVEWRCQNGTWSTTPPTQCSNGKLVLRIFFPDCLQVDETTGRPLLDSDDHRSHMVDAVTPSNGGFAECPPSTHIPVPRLQTNFQYPIPTTPGTVTLSSDHPGDPPGSTMHADFFNAWQKGALKDLVNRCINAGPFTATNPKPKDCL
jgi:Domain of unknown function (DUF1996)